MASMWNASSGGWDRDYAIPDITTTPTTPATDHSGLWDFLAGTGHAVESVGTEAVNAVKSTGKALGDFGGGLLGGIVRPLIVPLLLLILLVVALTVFVGRVERAGLGG